MKYINERNKHVSDYKSYKDTPGYRPMTQYAETKKNPGDYVFGVNGDCSIVRRDGTYQKIKR